MHPSETKILVCCHKQTDIPDNGIFLPVHCGKALSDKDFGMTGDDTGDNISVKNPNYCELTALYWAWKNLKGTEYIGLYHYRRYFGFSTFRAFLADIGYKVKTRRRIINTPDWRMSKVSGEQIRRVLDRYDIILGRPRRVHGSVWEQYSHYHPSAGLQVTREAIKALFPDYIDSFDYVMHKTKRLSRCNMFITGWKVFDDYCSWLFPVLSYVERHITIPEDPYQARIFGFIAERLLNVYCYHNRLKKTDRDIYEVTGSATPVNP